MNKQVRDVYGTAVGAVIDARAQREAARTTQRADGRATEQARGCVHRATTHRDEMRERHDAAVREEAYSHG